MAVDRQRAHALVQGVADRQPPTTGPRHTHRDPATGRPVVDVGLASPADVDAAVATAREALLAGEEYREGVGVVPTDEIEPMNVVVPEAASVENPAEPESGMASKLTESAAEADDSADEKAEADNAEAAEG